ncbi:MAG: hypothetical protein ABH834_06655 [Candidatus Altiarchaeota archaeon]
MSFGKVQELIEGAERLSVFQALVRTKYASGKDQRPSMILLTDKDLFYGGLDEEKKFKRIRRHEVSSVARKGKLMLACIELRYLEGSDEKRILVCPFTGHPSLPRIDYDRLAELEGLIGKWIPS